MTDGVWALTANVTQDSGTSGTFGLNGIEVAVRNFGSNANGATGYGFIGVAMGTSRNVSAFQAQSNTAGGGTSAQWTRGFAVDNTAKNSCTESCFYTASSTATYGINFQSSSFGTAAINIENCNTTYGVRTTGTQTIGIEAGNVSNASGTSGFRAIGGGSTATAFKCDTSSTYQNGLDFRGCNFAGGFEIATDGLKVANTGAIDFSNISPV